VISGARAAAVLLVRPSRFWIALSPQIKSIIAQNNGWRRVWQNSRNTQDRLEFKILNNLVRDLCRGLDNTAFRNKVNKLKPAHGSFLNFTKISKDKFRAIPTVKMDGCTLKTESEKVNAIASKWKKNGKAPGGDGVLNILLKIIPHRATGFLAYIYNYCLKLCYFPKEWKHAVVIPILKPGKLVEVSLNQIFLALLVI
jgi:hypothetical protein